MSLKLFITDHCPPLLRPTLVRITDSPSGLRLARGLFWSMTGTIISRGLMLLATVLVARILGKTAYGELGIIQSTVGMFGVFAGFGLGLTATKYVAEFRRNNPDRAGRIICLSGFFAVVTGGLISLGLFISAPWLATHTINAPHLANLLRIGSLLLFFTALNGAQTGALAGLQAFRTIAHVNVIAGLLSFPVLLCGVSMGGLTGAVWALTINLCFNWLLNHFALRREARRCGIPLVHRPCAYELPILWKFSMPAVMSGVMVGPVNWVCATLLVNEPGGYGEMGIYNAATQWFLILLFLPNMISGVVLPGLSEDIAQKDTKQAFKTLVLAIKCNAILVLPLVLMAGIASPFIMSSYGPDFSSGWKSLLVVLLTAGLVALQIPVGQFIAASGRMWVGFSMNAGWAITLIVATLLLLDLGALGLATSNAIAYTLHAIWVSIFAIWIFNKYRENEPAANSRLSTKEDWNEFFEESGTWEANGGPMQTRLFAEAFCKHTALAKHKEFSMLDSSCALGDAIPVFRKHFPKANLFACDFSTVAAKRSAERYGDMASVFTASMEDISGVYDVIYSSNTLEHYTDYKEIARALMRHCRSLCILVPFNETEIGPGLEHVASFSTQSFDFLMEENVASNIHVHKPFYVPKAWSWTLRTRIEQTLKNIIRILIKRPTLKDRKTILYEIHRHENDRKPQPT